ncbi:DUF3955 domain-containing protein [Balneatrix alpica]|uniref:DUF3955 domain-containing protein n=1 Tax=Balneatrix alpica TaxID=75684 RepID=A0ABV5ZDM8_9GAMM|nr:DUF3955 domain-containing protein [Balneatrix alpica]
MAQKKWRYLAGLCWGLALLSAASYHWIGVEVDSEGVLREPFGLIPLTWLLLLLGSVAGLLSLWRGRG